jgi:hypothetical protein
MQNHTEYLLSLTPAQFRSFKTALKMVVSAGISREDAIDLLVPAQIERRREQREQRQRDWHMRRA